MIKGKDIYIEIQRAMDEKSELGKACDAVSDEMGQSSVAYKILDKAYRETEKNVNRLLSIDYEYPDGLSEPF